jgi:hypothetical protein
VRTVKLLKRAEIELMEACDWYEHQQKGLSVRLRNEVSISIKIIAKTPHLYAERQGTNLRFTPLKKFPYLIIYWFDESLDTIFIASIFHMKRKPMDD